MSESKTVSDLAEEVTTYVAQFQAENAKLQASNEVIAEDHAALCEQNAKLRQIVARMWPMAIGAKRCTFADRLKLRAEIDELGIEVVGE